MSIAIKKSSNIQKSIKKIFTELNFVPKKRVYIKPNLSGRDPILPGENTSLEVMDALINVLHTYNCEIIIGHGALLGSFDHETTFQEVIESSGFLKYQNQTDVKLVNLDDLHRTEIKINEMTFHLPLDFLKNKIDTYINLAKIKTHMETSVSFSLKNQMGLPSHLDRVNMHKTNLEKTIAKLAKYCKPDLSILEGFPAMQGQGPHHGKIINLNLIVAGNDMVELDSFLCEILSIDSKKIKHIQYASQFGAGKLFNIDNINKYKDFFVNNFKQAKKVYNFGTRLKAYPTYSCSRCITAVNNAGKEFKKHPFKYWHIIFNAFFSKKIINIIFGKADNLKNKNNEKYICIGNCTKNFAEKNNLQYLNKCPPSIKEVREYIIKKIK